MINLYNGDYNENPHLKYWELQTNYNNKCAE